jgi:hypothetical protein
VDSNIHPEMESQKRRTTRIVQAVPLTVTGVDALGRPFQERTSSLIINCHGCRYQSKHYVLKNMWVTFEVPHNETGREARSVRARVTWIQRPRTVRELFQIGVELEIPGNVWGIAFPPGDWFPFPDQPSAAAVPAHLEKPGKPAPASEWEEPDEPFTTPQPEAQGSSENLESNVHVLPSPAGPEGSLQIARQVARLVAEAKQQVQGTVRETANRAVAEETRPLVAALQSQMKDAAEKSVEAAVAAYLERTQAENQQRAQKEMESNVASMRVEWARELDQRLTEARQQIDSQFAEVARSRKADFEKQIQDQVLLQVENLKNLGGYLGANAGDVRATIEQLRQTSVEAGENEARQWQEVMNQRTSEAQAHLAQLEEAAKRLADQISQVTTTAESGWHQLLDADLAAANSRLTEKIAASMEEAAREAADRLAQRNEASTRLVEQQLQQKIGAIGGAFSEVTAEAATVLGKLRAAVSGEAARGESTISQLQQAISHLEAKRGEIAANLEKSLDTWSQRAEAAVETHSNELHRRAESAVAGMAERLQPLLESSGRETIERLAGDFNQKLSPELARATEIMSQLAQDRDFSEKALAEHQQRVWQVSERSIQDSVTRGKELHAQVEKEFAESARAASAKWFSEMESKASETTHGTFEALFKSAEWYEKKVQNQMQATLERGVDQAASSLREKAAELSGLFASELDHYSRSYVDHAQTQIQDSARETAGHAAELMAEASSKAAQEFTDRAGYLGLEQLELYAAKADAAFDQTAARVEEHTAQVRSKLESDTSAFAAKYQRALSEFTQQSLAQSKEDLTAQVEQAKDNLLLETQTLDHQFQTGMQSLSAQSMEEHKQRLENASSSWLLTTVTKLNQQSEDLIEQLAASTEKKLKAVCGNVFAEMGESLRQRLAGFSDPRTAPTTRPSPFTLANPNPFDKKPEDSK